MTKAERERDARQRRIVANERARKLRDAGKLPLASDLFTRLDELGGAEAVGLARDMLRGLE